MRGTVTFRDRDEPRTRRNTIETPLLPATPSESSLYERRVRCHPRVERDRVMLAVRLYREAYRLTNRRRGVIRTKCADVVANGIIHHRLLVREIEILVRVDVDGVRLLVPQKGE